MCKIVLNVITVVLLVMELLISIVYLVIQLQGLKGKEFLPTLVLA